MTKPKFRFSLTEIVILLLVFSIVTCVTGFVRYTSWHENMAMTLDEDASYVIDDVDLTDQIQYQCITDSYMIGLLMTLYGIWTGIMIDTALMVAYTAIKTLVFVLKFARHEEITAQNEANPNLIEET